MMGQKVIEVQPAWVRKNRGSNKILKSLRASGTIPMPCSLDSEWSDREKSPVLRRLKSIGHRKRILRPSHPARYPIHKVVANC